MRADSRRGFRTVPGHTGNNLAAAAGASTRELMHRMGHYWHAYGTNREQRSASVAGAEAGNGP
jgi:hypothetical protein